MSGQRLVSIDIGSRNIHIVEGAYRADVLEVKKAVLANTPEGSWNDGRIEDEARLKHAIEEALTANRIKTGSVVFTIQSSIIVTRDFVLPVLNKEDMMGAVTYEMEQYLPPRLEGYNIEYKTGQAYLEENIKKCKVRAAAMPVPMSDSYYRLARELKLKPAALDIHSNAISKLFSKPFKIRGELYDNDKTYAFIDMGAKTTAINIMSKGRLELSRILSFGAEDLDRSLAQRFGISAGKARQEKAGFDIGSAAGSKDAMEHALRQGLEQQMAEIQKLFHFYISRNPGSSIQKIFLYGGGADVNGLDGFIKSLVNIDAEKINHLDKIRANEELKPGPGFYLNAAAALIQY